MIDPDINEPDALQALLASDGWQLFQAFLEQEWGATAYARKIDHAITAAKQARDSAEGDICELGAACRAVRLAAQWPTQRLAALQGAKPASSGFLGRRRA